MKLLASPGSPYARKVRIVLAEKGIPCEYVIARPSDPDSGVVNFNPLVKVPVLVRDDGRGLYDSSVIVDYVDGLTPAPKLIPVAFEDRIEVRRWEALGDGIAESTVEISHDLPHPPEKRRDEAWYAKHYRKIDNGLATMEKDVAGRTFCFGDSFTLADAAAGYALSYLDRVLPNVEWRKGHPNLAKLAERLFARPSFRDTLPPPV